MKLIEITALIIFIAGILLGSCDSDDFTVFLWSKIAAVSLMGLSALIFKLTWRQ
jgi:hypothetical protein